ncbi:hypothetical protein WJX72_003282 [[Myrmecia] bisecta]|uniref:protein-serine/threonine phosphatase n=1 Tax=[Myrmecia] bisecta TaxID=41462 RepID=A0AAW1R6Q9_9CHLO
MGAYLATPVTDKETFEGSSKHVSYGGASMQGWRRSMEDAHIALTHLAGDETAAVFGVFDGHGGSEVAKFCQKYLARELTKLQQYQEGNIGDSLVEVFHRMDLLLKQDQYSKELEEFGGRLEEGAAEDGEGSDTSTAEAMAMLKKIMELRKIADETKAKDASAKAEAAGELPVTNPGLGAAGQDIQDDVLPEHKLQAGCTAVVAVIKGNKLYVANAGDSRAVLCRNGRAIALSEDHKPAQEGERARIQAAGGFVSDIAGVCRVNGNLNLSRAIGDLKYKGNNKLGVAEQIITAQPDVMQMELTAEDAFFVLACDGVWDVLTNQEVVDFVAERLKQGICLTEIAKQMLDRCLATNPKENRGIGCDNMTATIVQLLPQTPPAMAQ